MTYEAHGHHASVVQSRRAFVAGVTAVIGGLAVVTTGAAAQQAAAPGGEAMTADSYKPISRPAKPGATPTMDAKQVEAFERQLACPCPCTLDIYTCRTTDFTCGISPAVHGDIQRLVDGGYTGAEIMEALTGTYGDFILNAPRKEGFSLVAWFAPFAAVAFGAVGIGALLRSWRVNAKVADAARPARSHVGTDPAIDATPEELARLQAALREDK
ncbi:cytochrome c-type biogenesis protein [Gemmatimonas sp.]